jgi:predicted nucleic acid-binding protein
MPLLTVLQQEIDLPRNIALLDTNVLVAYFDDRDNDHDQSVLVLEENIDYAWVVTLPVIIEACGLLASRRNLSVVIRLLNWILTPGQVVVLPGSHPTLSSDGVLASCRGMMSRYSLDYVDAHLMDLAHNITQQFDLRPHLPIVTFDTKDFVRCAGLGRLYSVYDVRGLEFLDFQI